MPKRGLKGPSNMVGVWGDGRLVGVGFAVRIRRDWDSHDLWIRLLQTPYHASSCRSVTTFDAP
jgi:hypothetical protein